jgi:hypothetical protein
VRSGGRTAARLTALLAPEWRRSWRHFTARAATARLQPDARTHGGADARVRARTCARSSRKRSRPGRVNEWVNEPGRTPAGPRQEGGVDPASQPPVGAPCRVPAGGRPGIHRVHTGRKHPGRCPGLPRNAGRTGGGTCPSSPRFRPGDVQDIPVTFRGDSSGYVPCSAAARLCSTAGDGLLGACSAAARTARRAGPSRRRAERDLRRSRAEQPPSSVR